ncbi:c-type cytochrome [Thiohalophilus thiocyanatoxydans]|uniref:c-type cytochrome n=1 Tax=Thiohalophilus thiocyanatoxydans TaxID=381308 RepID=UPI001416FD63|nr:cytochrome c [Thiohalophilus thiocyanatoxydans]
MVALLLVDAYTVVRAEMPAGKSLYENNCVVCHGHDGEGAMPGVRSMISNRLWTKQSDQELVAMIINGVESTDGPVSMPPKGGNPALTEEQIHSIVNYLRILVDNN